MIVVFGATGNTGLHLVRDLLARGLRTRVAARDPEKARRLIGQGPEYVRADLLQPESLNAALAGAQGLYVAVGGMSGTPDLVAAESRLINVAKASGVAQYVHVSGIDAAVEGPARVQRWHAEIEVAIEKSGVPFTILRPNFFMQNFLGMAGAIRTGVLPLPAGEARASLIDARDIAHAAAVVLSEPGHLGRRYTLTGPDPISHRDVAAMLGEVMGHRVEYLNVPPPAFAQAGRDAGMPGWFAELLTDVYVQVLAAGRAERVTDDVRRLTGRPARSFATFAQDHRAAFRGP
ncbi:MAG: SDR family oxidoreductase [Deltaproteobacteria bacterium]|nr:SDR family oxidoreductase [Deltaproteobacteria bacterium]